MADKFAIDGHKLIYHPRRVARFLNGETIYPLYLEISPYGGCNHRCRFCALDYLGYEKQRFDTELLKRRVKEMARLGVKSIMYAGEGEPFLHPDMVDIARHTKTSGIDVAFTTNGVKIPEDGARSLLQSSTFIKISINAGTSDTYQRVHRAPRGDFEKVQAVSANLIETRLKHRLSCTVGWQMLLLPENQEEALRLANAARDIGVDYLVIKPFSRHPRSRNMDYADLAYGRNDALADALASFETDSFNIVYRNNAIEKTIAKSRRYKQCFGLNFWAYIDTKGNIWGCIPHIGDKQMYYGNLGDSSFEDIWNGERRKAVLEFVENELDVEQCRVNCRMDKVNEYLFDLKHPANHVNFI